MNLPSKEIYKHNVKTSKIQSCAMSLDDLRKLFDMLCQKAEEALKIEIAFIREQTSYGIEEPETTVKSVTDTMKLSIQIKGTKGEFIYGLNKSVLSQEDIPEDLQTVIFNNSAHYNLTMRKFPANSFEVRIDFKRPKIFDFIASPSEATHNESKITVSGNNETWVVGVYQKIVSFFDDRKKSRALIHSRNTYDLLFLFIIIPISFYMLFRIQPYFYSVFSNVKGLLYIGLNIWAFLIIANVFRFLFNYVRWTFPLVEFIEPQGSVVKTHRGVLVFILFSLVAMFIEGLVRFVF